MAPDHNSNSVLGKEFWLVRDIVVGAQDSRGQKIERIYSKVREKFAIYSADGKIWIQYADEGRLSADDRDLGEEQRKALAPLRALRGQIDGYQRKLKIALEPDGEEDRTEVDFYNQRVADALFSALQGNPVSAIAELGEIRADILDRLRSLGRLQFAKSTLLATILTLAALAGVILLAAMLEALFTDVPMKDTQTLDFMYSQHLWVAGLFGSLGAWFSIALTLRKADPKLSTSKLDNLVDPALRIVIAVLAATILFSMVRLDLFTLQIGDKALNWDGLTNDLSWRGLHLAIFLAFLAGFSERLVGNLLDTVERTSAPSAPAVAGAAAALTAAATETDPMGRSTGNQERDGARPGDPPPDDDPEPDPPQRDEQILAAEATPDEMLPPASGGVAAQPVEGGGRK